MPYNNFAVYLTLTYKRLDSIKNIINSRQYILDPKNFYRIVFFSRSARYFEAHNSRIYGEKLASFFRIDLQAEWKIQYANKTASLIIGVQNCTNRKNPVSQSYDSAIRQIKYTNLLGIIPVFGIKVDL